MENENKGILKDTIKNKIALYRIFENLGVENNLELVVKVVMQEQVHYQGLYLNVNFEIKV